LLGLNASLSTYQGEIKESVKCY